MRGRPAPGARTTSEREEQRGTRAVRAVAALAREAQVAGPAAHPGIRRLLESRLDQPLPHLVFEYVEGPTLDDALADEGPLHPIDVLLTGMQLAAALGHQHDLGLARPVGEPAGRHRRGSPPWMAPEQVRRQPASPAMDLFALGAVLFELATGTQAFDPADVGPPERRWPQLAGPAPSASSRHLEVPAAVDREDRLWPDWATGRLPGWPASAMERPPPVPRPA